MEYMTVLGDTFDKIAKLKYGDEKLAIHIIEANIEYSNVIIFGAGVKLKIPDIVVPRTSNLPPWKRGGN